MLSPMAHLVCLQVCVLLVTSPAVQAQISYVESSSGLATPAMESGRTEFEFGDVNGDGHPDLVSIGDHGSPYVNTNEHGIMVWFGDGSGQWSVYQTGEFGYGGIALGDVNNDTFMDVAYGMHHNYSGVDFGDQLLEVALGDGTGQNWVPWDDGLATSGEWWGMFGTDFADVDNDGDLDVGSLSFGCCNGVRVYLNQGDGTWVQSFSSGSGNSDQDMFFGDINGDGLADLAATYSNGTVYFGDGAGGFTLADGDLPPPAYRRGLHLGDVNDDGRDDLSFVNDNEGLEVWTWVGPGDWEPVAMSLPSMGDFRSTKIADMNLDGHGDLIAFAWTDPGLVSIYAGDGAGNWQLATTITTMDNCGFAALAAGADADHNGYPDFLIVEKEDCDWLGNGRNTPRFFAEASTPGVPWIYPKYPRGGEVFVAGSVRFLDWSMAVPEGDPPTVTLELSRTGPDGPWTPIATNQPNNGRYQWLLPPDLRSSTQCHVRYTSAGVSAVTPGQFTVIGVHVSPGDFDGDGDVDLVDYSAFHDCCAGPDDLPQPEPPVAVEDCHTAFDFDEDQDVDLADAGRFQAAFGSM